MNTILACFVSAVIGATPAMAAGPTGRVVPSRHLTNGQTVKVTASGFMPGEQVYIAECNSNLPDDGEQACDLNTYIAVSATPKGRVAPVGFDITAGVIGNGTCGTRKTDRKCYIAITNGSLTNYANVPVVFDVP